MGVDVVPGTLELLLLKTLSRGDMMHGFAILQWLRRVTRGDLVVEEGALYPALHRLERRRLLSAEWGVSEKGRRAKYYRITARGREQLEAEEARWTQYMAAWRRIARAASVPAGA
ncbi:MAG TPA: PadR family transcriptional regulator [Longimicrobiales bacterium]|nr:PadR family transcriptional regulator [Longimicrobiales bacterium]